LYTSQGGLYTIDINTGQANLINSFESEVTMCAVVTGTTSAAINNIVVFISPNPTNGLINISADDVYDINIVDLSGKIIYSKQMDSNFETIDISNLSNGIYFVRFNNELKTKTLKILKQ